MGLLIFLGDLGVILLGIHTSPVAARAYRLFRQVSLAELNVITSTSGRLIIGPQPCGGTLGSPLIPRLYTGNVSICGFWPITAFEIPYRRPQNQQRKHRRDWSRIFVTLCAKD